MISAVWFALGTSALPAADFWQKKNYSDWTAEEVTRMLWDSPWARKAPVRLKGDAAIGGSGMGSGDMEVDNPADMHGAMDAGRGDEEGGGGPRGVGGGRAPATPSPPRIEVIVRWQTALPIKQAIARFHYGDYAQTSWKIGKMLALQEPYYIAGIIGLPQRLAGTNPDDLQSFATLKVGNLPPIRAVAVMNEKLMSAEVNVYFFFPKLQAGAHVVTAADSEVEMRLDAPKMEIRRKFKLKDLMYSGKPEL